MDTIMEMFERLKSEGGRIISSASMHVEDIEQARASGRFYIDDEGFGFAWIPDLWFPKTTEEVELFERYYPLPSTRPIPERLNPDRVWDEIRKAEEEEKRARLN